MTTYVISICLIIFIIALTQKKVALKNGGLLASFFILWLISSTRDSSVGNDTEAYVDFYQNVSSGAIDVIGNINLFNPFDFQGFENGFQLYNYLLSFITSDYTTFFMVTYGIIYFSFYRLINKYSSDPLLSMVIYINLFFFNSMSALRQALAMAILTWGFKYIEKRKFIKYAAIVLIATLFHQASIVMIFPYFMYSRSISMRSILLYLSVALALLLFASQIVITLANENIRYAFYIERLDSYSTGSFITLAMFTLVALYMYFIYKINLKNAKDEVSLRRGSFTIKTMLLTVVSSIVSLGVNALSRFNTFFMMYNIIMIPNLMAENKIIRRMNSSRLTLVILLFAYSFTLLILRPEWLGITDYQSIIGNK